MEEMDAGFAEFAEAFESGDGYQTDVQEETTEIPEQTTQTPQEQPEDGETTEDAPAEKTADQDDGGKPEQTFTIKVNKQERQVTQAEMTELAQKGADYDRIRGKLEENSKTLQTLQAQLDQQQEYMETLKLISEQTNLPTAQLLEQMHINLLKGKGMSEAEAKAEIRAAKAEKQLKALDEQQTRQKAATEDQAARAQREVAEFRGQFPDVEITQELCQKLTPDIQAGMSMTNAYLKMENARKDAEIAELQRKQAAAKQNEKNRAQSPGSQRDDGGQRAKTEFDEFMAAFA